LNHSAADEKVKESIEDQKRELFQRGPSPAFLNWTQIYDPDRQVFWPSKQSNNSLPSILYYALFMNLSDIAESIIDEGLEDVNAQNGGYGTVLQLACLRGTDALVRKLLDKGVDVNVEGGWFGSALQAAAARGKLDTVRLLLSKGADPNLEGGVLGCPLLASRITCYPKISETLITYGAKDDPAYQGPLGEFLTEDYGRRTLN
jgi:ankyrin repeat protein